MSAQTNAVHEWTLADGTATGLGTEAEFNHWKSEGVLSEETSLGRVLGYEPASLDAERAARWAA